MAFFEKALLHEVSFQLKILKYIFIKTIHCFIVQHEYILETFSTMSIIKNSNDGIFYSGFPSLRTLTIVQYAQEHNLSEIGRFQPQVKGRNLVCCV
jgi:hypothetical protein